MEFIIKIIVPLEDDPPLVEWEFFPHVGPRPSKGFVGLKNAGATCYMNAVLQQVLHAATCTHAHTYNVQC